MKKIDNTMFDQIAKDYYSFSPSIPEEYIKHIGSIFDLKQKDKIIDLGCGSGELALGLTQYSSSVEGIDISQKMIELARTKDRNNKVTWIHDEMDNMNLETNRYKLIISHESFHLFPHPKNIIKKCVEALQPEGFLGIGWATYEWEESLQGIITETLSPFGGSWDNMWTCPSFSETINQKYSQICTIHKKKIKIPSQTPIQNIAHYLFSISQTYTLKKTQKKQLFHKLLHKFKEVYPSGESKGETIYTIIYVQKK